jgi:two-component system nitrate/nitrite response regulator NarL
VSDIRLYRDALVHALETRDGVNIVGTASGPREVLASISELRPNVVIVDVAAPAGLVAVRSIVGGAPEARVVALALPEGEADVIACAEAGASGYVPRDGTLADLEAVIRSVAQGEALLSPKVTASVLRRLAHLAAGREPPPFEVRLTSRETEIIELIDQGLSNKEIAQRLSIAISTVKNHVHSILNKLNVERRAAAVACLRGSHSPDAVRRAS